MPTPPNPQVPSLRDPGLQKPEREREGEISPHAHNWGGVGRRGESARRRRGQGATITCLDSGGTSALIGKGLGVVWL